MKTEKWKDQSDAGRMLSYLHVWGILLILLFFLLTLPRWEDPKSREAEATPVRERVEEKRDGKEERMASLAEAFREQGVALEVDPESGTVRLPGSVLFKQNSSRLSVEGKQYLEEKVPLYLGILMQDAFRDEISSIIIEGHADRDGSYMYNMKLSQDRAQSVFQYIYSEEFPPFDAKERSKSYMTVSGRSDSVPVYTDGKYDSDQSRRAEIRFRLKDAAAIQALEKWVKE